MASVRPRTQMCQLPGTCMSVVQRTIENSANKCNLLHKIPRYKVGNKDDDNITFRCGGPSNVWHSRRGDLEQLDVWHTVAAFGWHKRRTGVDIGDLHVTRLLPTSRHDTWHCIRARIRRRTAVWRLRTVVSADDDGRLRWEVRVRREDRTGGVRTFVCWRYCVWTLHVGRHAGRVCA